MKENILEFPKKNQETFPSSIEESILHITAVRQEYCDEIHADVMDAVVNILNSYGLVIKSEEDFIKDYVFVEEGLKALIYRHKRLPHQFHEITDAVITLTDEAKSEIAAKNKQSEKQLTID